MPEISTSKPASLKVALTERNALQLTFAGDWKLGSELPALDEAQEALKSRINGLEFDSSELGDWDTAFVTRLLTLHKYAQANSVEADESGLPDGARRLIALSLAVGERSDTKRSTEKSPFLARVGEVALTAWQASLELLSFTGELVQSLGRFIRGKATYRRQNLFVYIQEAGAEALPIVALISLLIGMIFAFVGVMQLNLFGAGIYTADLVAVAMIREIAAIMTAIIMAGRTGAAYAAEIGTMKVNEEVDALTTLGINPIDFLVTPRVIALVLMMPLLTMFSSLMGIIGGMLVGLSMLDVSFQQYVEQTISSVRLNFLFGGLFKSIVYGSLVALAGTMQGMACGSSAMAVGVATTKAVVMGIVLIVVSASVLTIIYINLGI
jgi:phospholipid/cholesterol/gamma-HCH transport system permease protein